MDSGHHGRRGRDPAAAPQLTPAKRRPPRTIAPVSVFTFISSQGTVLYGRLAAFSIRYATPAVVRHAVMARGPGGGFALGGALKR